MARGIQCCPESMFHTFSEHSDGNSVRVYKTSSQKDELHCLSSDIMTNVYMLHGSVWYVFAVPSAYAAFPQGAPPGPPPKDRIGWKVTQWAPNLYCTMQTLRC